MVWNFRVVLPRNRPGAWFRFFIGANGDYQGFEDQIVGHNKGEQFDITVQFPDTYMNTEMAGKVAVFTITLNGIYTVDVPKLTDKWVKENSVEATTVKEYKKEIKEKSKTSRCTRIF